MKFRLFCLILAIFCFDLRAYANESGPGLSVTYPIKTLEPENLQGYRLSVFYQPERFIGKFAKLYFDASFGHWWDDDTFANVKTNPSVNIFSIAPIIRFFYSNNTFFTPFIDASVGFSYLSKTLIYKRNLGIHFSFQDQLALGASFGKNQHLSVSIGGLHYSNGSLCQKNSGMTIPLFLNVGYRL